MYTAHPNKSAAEKKRKEDASADGRSRQEIPSSESSITASGSQKQSNQPHGQTKRPEHRYNDARNVRQQPMVKAIFVDEMLRYFS